MELANDVTRYMLVLYRQKSSIDLHVSIAQASLPLLSSHVHTHVHTSSALAARALINKTL